MKILIYFSMYSTCADPMQNVVQVLEKQYLEEKRTALEEQRMMYERELESLRQQLSPEKTAQQHHSSSERLAFPVAAHGKLRLWTEERSVRLSEGLGTENSLCLVWIWSPGVGLPRFSGFKPRPGVKVFQCDNPEF